MGLTDAMAAIYDEDILYGNSFFMAPKPRTMISNGLGKVNTVFYFIGYEFWHIGQHKLYSDIIYFQKAVFQNTILCKLSFNKTHHTKDN